MKKLILLLFVLIPIFAHGQTRTYSYGNWISQSSVDLTLTDSDQDTAFFSFRVANSSDAVSPTSTGPINPPDNVFWSGHGTISITPDTLVSDVETDSLKIWVYGLDQAGNIMVSQKVYLDFTAGVGDWDDTEHVLDWSPGVVYSASIGGAFSPVMGIAVIVEQDATAQGTTVNVNFIRD